jgi:hypothetical protein
MKFEGRKHYFEKINKHFSRPGATPLVVVAESGLGKVLSCSHSLTFSISRLSSISILIKEYLTLVFAERINGELDCSTSRVCF